MTDDLGPAVLRTDLPFPVRRGKVRDVYDLGDAPGLIVATDRVSAFDVVLADRHPGQGAGPHGPEPVLARTPRRRGAENHLLSSDDVARYLPAAVRGRARTWSRGRSMLVRKAGGRARSSAWPAGTWPGPGGRSTSATGSVCGVPLPAGLREAERLPEPIFTPATKADDGARRERPVRPRWRPRSAPDLAAGLRDPDAARCTRRAAAFAAWAGAMIVADTKLEFGMVVRPDGGGRRAMLIDEVLTPDSSRFWPAERYAAGSDVPSFDKQFVRDWLERQPWDKRPPAPPLPPEVIAGTRRRYLEAFERLTRPAVRRLNRAA